MRDTRSDVPASTPGDGPDDAARRAFVLEHTRLGRPPLVPEVLLHLASDSTSLWRATEAWLAAHGVEPPYWAFAWAGGQALARTLLDAPDFVRGRRVVDVGTGGGIVALAAARAGARHVVALDRDRTALAALALNADANGLSVEALLADATEGPFSEADLIVAGDLFYDREVGPRVAATLTACAARGATVLGGCPGRVGTPEGAREIAAHWVGGTLDLEGKSAVFTRVFRF